MLCAVTKLLVSDASAFVPKSKPGLVHSSLDTRGNGRRMKMAFYSFENESKIPYFGDEQKQLSTLMGIDESDLPKLSLQKKTVNKAEYYRLLSIEMIFGRIAMVSAIFLITVEATGGSFLDQVLGLMDFIKTYS